MSLKNELREAAATVETAESLWDQHKTFIIGYGAACFAFGFLFGLVF